MTKGSIDDGVVFHAGFPNAAEDGKFGSLSLDTLVVRHRSSTYFWRLEADISERGWSAGDIVVVDRVLRPRADSIVIVVDDDSFVIARQHNGRLYRLDDSGVPLGAVVWGVVTYVVQKV